MPLLQTSVDCVAQVCFANMSAAVVVARAHSEVGVVAVTGGRNSRWKHPCLFSKFVSAGGGSGF